MAILSNNELFPGRDGNVDFLRRRTYTRVFEVYTDDPLDEAFVVSSAIGLPLRGESYPFDLFARCISINPKQDDADPLRWEVTCKYDSQPTDLHQTQPDGSSKDPKDQPDNPLDEPPEWKFGWVNQEKVMTHAYASDPVTWNNVPGTVAVVNTVGDMFDPPLMYNDAYMTCTVTGNVPDVDMVQLSQLMNSVNLTTWKGFGPYCAKCEQITADTAWKNNIPYWRLSMTFGFKPVVGWWTRVLNAGYRRLQDPGYSTQRAVPITVSGYTPNVPVPLDANSQPIAIPPPGQFMQGYFLRFNTYRQREFNNLVPW
jgi:hypothetical protein